MLDSISKIPPLNLVIILAFVFVIILMVLKTVKELSLKIGGNVVSFSSREKQSEIVKVVTEYADFKYKIKEEQAEGIQDLHSQAKRTVAVHLDQYIKHITADYISALNKGGGEDATLTINIFSLLIRLLYNTMFRFLMDIFEQNHLKDRSDSELKELAATNYMRLADIFREFMQTNWIEVMEPYDILHGVCLSEAEFVRGLVLRLLFTFRDLSRQKYELINTINDIDCKVRRDVQSSGALPANAISILSDLYISGTGLNKNSVEKWLSKNKIENFADKLKDKNLA